MKIQSAWHFFFSPCWSDFETPRDPSWTETGVLQHFLLAHSISSSKCGFLCVWWGSSSMWIFSQVLFWFCLFPLRPFCQRLDNGCNHFRLRYKHSWFTARREWGAGRQRSCRQSAGSLDRSSVPSVQLVREWLGGSSRRGGMKWWENWGLQAVKFSSNTWIMFIRGCKHDIFYTLLNTMEMCIWHALTLCCCWIHFVSFWNPCALASSVSLRLPIMLCAAAKTLFQILDKATQTNCYLCCYNQLHICLDTHFAKN